MLECQKNSVMVVENSQSSVVHMEGYILFKT